MIVAKTKMCSECKQDLHTDNFFRRKTKSGFRSRCKSCEKHCRRPSSYYQRLKAKYKPEEFKELMRTQTLKAKYGIDPLEYDRLFELQGGKCAICKRQSDDELKLFVDHDHVTDIVRGLLCSRCNSCLERIESDRDWGTKAIAYLGVHKSNTNTTKVVGGE